MPIISAKAIERGLMVCRASDVMLEAMQRFTTEEGELTVLEWLKAFQTLQARLIAEGVTEEWKE